MCSLALLYILAWSSAGQAGTPGEINLQPPAGMRSRSLAYVHRGALRRGMRLRESEYIRHVPDYAAGGHFYGTWETVQLLERAARWVAFRAPGARLSVGELARNGGGRLAGHRSHQSGRDVDVAFYMRVVGSPRAYEASAFVEFDREGRGAGAMRALRFDEARNWQLLTKLVTDAEARVQYIFVADHLKARLLAYGRAVGSSVVVLERAATVMLQPSHGHPHANHFHVRVYCAPDDRPACRDQAPFWPWYPGRIPGGLFSSLGRTQRVFD
ncbi:MAG: penicillin-insensitive murein endopeptidase [Myxococcales bacterium]|nr:penicillin-insensitive murein endopeptidase [Myxococcales bacterium]